MRVVLAEKPSVAAELARALGCTKRERGYFSGGSGGKDIVTYAVGHLVRMAEPGEMNPDWGKPWRRETLPMVPRASGLAAGSAAWGWVAEPRTEEQFEVVKRLLNDRRVTEIVNATDAGREGEAIFRRIYELAGCRKPVRRFWTSSLTEEAIGEALGRLRPAAEFDNLAAAAQARAQLDWLIGMNHTRASTLHNGVLCSIGRVQTPTLAMIVRRHHEIANWVRTFYYEVHADIQTVNSGFIARAVNKAGKHDFDKQAEAEAILADVPEGTPAVVTAVEKKRKRVPPPQLHNLGELQKEANRRFGLGADRTLEIAQTLYERKAITYPRSSSRYLSEDMEAGLGKVLRALHFPGRETVLAQALARAALIEKGKGPKLGKRFIDGSKLSDHHAIIPTTKGGGLGGDEARVYQIVAERFCTMFLPDKESEETRIDLVAAGHRFRAKGSVPLAPGWTALGSGSAAGGGDIENKGEDVEDRQSLPAVREGEVLAVLDAELVKKERKPPAKFTDATLLSAMETAGREIDDDALREAMRGRGLGTEATRAAIIKNLEERDYIVRVVKNFEATGKGIALIAQVLPILPNLASPELTGDMEAKLGLVEAGKLEAATLLEEVARDLRRDIPAVFGSSAMVPAKVAPLVLSAEAAARGEMVCPKCGGGTLTQKNGFWGCSRYREGCGFSINTMIAGKALTDAQVKQLISAKRRTKTLKGFKSKAGKSFDAMLVLGADWKVGFEFER